MVMNPFALFSTHLPSHLSPLTHGFSYLCLQYSSPRRVRRSPLLLLLLDVDQQSVSRWALRTVRTGSSAPVHPEPRPAPAQTSTEIFSILSSSLGLRRMLLLLRGTSRVSRALSKSGSSMGASSSGVELLGAGKPPNTTVGARGVSGKFHRLAPTPLLLSYLF